MKKLSLIILGMFAATALLLAVPIGVEAATAKQAACDGIGATAGAGGCTDGSGKSISDLLALVINIFSWVVGVVAVIFIIVAGFKYITSGGDSTKVKSAKDTLVYALVGLVVVVLAQVLVKFVLTKTNEAVTSQQITVSSYFFDKLS